MQTTTLVERYQHGDHVAVWEEMLALGEGVRHELYYADAVAVAAETMRRARYNVEVIIGRLAEMGYRFFAPAEEYVLDLDSGVDQMMKSFALPAPGGVDLRPHLEAAVKRIKDQLGPAGAKIAERNAAQAAKVAESLRKAALDNRDIFDPPGPRTAKDLQKLERKAGGPLPISLRAWYEQVGGVSLMGSHEVLNPRQDETADPLVVAPLGELLKMVEWSNDGEEGIALWIAPDDLHKANISGGDPYTIRIPNASADVPLEYEWHDTTFVSYLRKAFAWGGFPGWERSENPPRQLIARLREGLLDL